MAPDGLYGKIFCDFANVVQIVNTDSRNRLVLCEELYIAGSKDKGNTLKPYIYLNTVVLKMVVLEHPWVPSLVYPCVIKLCLPLIQHT